MVKPGHRSIFPAINATLIYLAMYYVSTKIELQSYLWILGAICLFHVYVFIEIILLRSKRPLRYYVPGIIYLALAASSVHFFQYYASYQLDMFMIFFMVWASDTGSYFLGKFYGKRPLAPSISPNKTIEGFFGGWILGFLFFGILCLCNVVTWKVMVIAFIVHIIVVAGDLIESKLKRIAQVKDSSNLIPGHGGFLDRSDGLLFALPFAVLLYYFIILK